jgi:hypothetical protein
MGQTLNKKLKKNRNKKMNPERRMAMTYKNKLYFLIALIAVLVLLYVGSLIYNSDFGNRQESFAWLDSKAAEKISKINISTHMNEFEIFTRNNMWFILHENNVYPARQLRVQDFLNILTTRSVWPVRSSSASTHERFGLLAPDEMPDDGFFHGLASRLTVYADNVVLLDLLLGNDDIYRNETYYRRYGQNEVRSGESGAKIYLNSHVSAWFNLRLVTGNDGGEVDLGSVQRLSVYTPYETQVFSRRNRGWVISGIEVENPDAHAIESYIRGILITEGDGFDNSMSWDDPAFEYSRMELELGQGRIITIRLTMADEMTGRIFAHVSGSELIYSIPSWSANRLYREAESFNQ